jgi:hypothetical protein
MVRSSYPKRCAEFAIETSRQRPLHSVVARYDAAMPMRALLFDWRGTLSTMKTTPTGYVPVRPRSDVTCRMMLLIGWLACSERARNSQKWWLLGDTLTVRLN